MDWRQTTNIGIAMVGLVATGTLVVALWVNRFDPVLTNLVLRNFPTIIGLPFAFIASFAVVALFRQGESAVEFKGFGMEFKGASGEIVLWLLCFVAIAGMIKLLWKA